VNKRIFEVAASTSLVTGTIVLKQASSGKNVIVDGLAFSFV
jgi:hypothetical protein